MERIERQLEDLQHDVNEIQQENTDLRQAKDDQEKTINALNAQVNELLETIERYKQGLEDMEQWYTKRGQAEQVRYELARERWVRTCREMERQIKEVSERYLSNE